MTASVPNGTPGVSSNVLLCPHSVMAGYFELKPISIGENRLEVATFCRQLRASTRAAPSEPRCCVYRFTSMRAPFPADASPPSRETDPTVPISSILSSIRSLPAFLVCGHFSGGYNIEFSCPAAQSHTATDMQYDSTVPNGAQGVNCNDLLCAPLSRDLHLLMAFLSE
jgi:hypothetical protein